MSRRREERKYFFMAMIFLSIPFINGGDCGPKFNDKCSCGMSKYNDRIQYVVNCTNNGFREVSMLQHLPLQTEVLIWTGNNVSELPWNIFGAFNNLVNLTIVDMSNNNIREIKGKSYHHVPNVKCLILNHNNLRVLNYPENNFKHRHPRVFSNFINLLELHLTNAFDTDNSSAELSENLHEIFVNSNLTKLTKLHLEQNEIKTFKDKRLFCDLPSLKYLYLGDNFLEEINFDILCLHSLRLLDLKRNKITRMKSNDLNVLDILSNTTGHDLMIDLSDNQLTCDCRINDLHDWLKRTKVKINNLNTLSCFNRGNRFQSLLSVKIDKCLILSKSSITTKSHSAMLVFIFVAISIILFTTMAALIYIKYDSLKRIIYPSISNVSRKVQYTKIKDVNSPEAYI